MPRPVIVLLAAALLAAPACERPSRDQADRELAARALPDMLLYPQSAVVRVSAGTEAAEVTLTAPAGADEVASWYRRFLVSNDWQLQSEGRQPDGALVIHAIKEGRPLWVTVRPSVGGPGTTYTLVGVAPPDTTP